MSLRLLPKLRACGQRVAFSKNAAIGAVQRCSVSTTSPLFEVHTVKVPTMGDSITEGTIVEWTTSIGQGVKDGDVVALVETDKVTVEIKADMDGVVTKQFGAVDDTVEVGTDLYEIDTEAKATFSGSAEAEESSTRVSAEAPKNVENTAPAKDTSKPEQGTSTAEHRSPSIQFLGKEGWRQKLHSEQAAAPAPVEPIPPMYGRPKFTEEEIEALLSGGANMSPQVKQHSGGAMFGY